MCSSFNILLKSVAKFQFQATDVSFTPVLPQLSKTHVRRKGNIREPIPFFCLRRAHFLKKSLSSFHAFSSSSEKLDWNSEIRSEKLEEFLDQIHLFHRHRASFERLAKATIWWKGFLVSFASKKVSDSFSGFFPLFFLKQISSKWNSFAFIPKSVVVVFWRIGFTITYLLSSEEEELRQNLRFWNTTFLWSLLHQHASMNFPPNKLFLLRQNVLYG